MRRIVLFLYLALFISLNFQAQWMPCPGLEGANISQILVCDSMMFISGSGNGVFRKHVNDQEWGMDHYNGYYRKLRANDTCIFAANDSWYSNFSRSFDLGETWEELDDVYALEIIGDNIFTIASPGMGTHIYRSGNNGSTWDLLKEDTSGIYFWELFANDSTLFCTNEISEIALITNDLGNSWETISMECDDGYIWADALYNYNGVYFAGTYKDEGVYYYDSSLDYWFGINNNVDYISPKDFIEINDVLYCCSWKGFYKLNQQDSIWVKQTEQLGNTHVNCAYLLGERIYIATSKGSYYSDDGIEWIPEIKGLFQLNVQQIIPENDTIYALSGSKMYYSLDPEIGFNTLETDWIVTPRDIYTTDSLWYAGSDSGFMISRNSGYSWEYFNEGFEFNSRVNNVAVTNDFVFAGKNGLYKAHKDTMIFRRVPNWIGDELVMFMASINDILFASIQDEGVFRSEDLGNTFQHIPESSSFDDEIHVIDGKVYIYGYSEVYRSSDLGVNWEMYQDSIWQGWHNTLDVVEETMVIASAYALMNDVWIYIYSPLYPDGLMINDNIPTAYWPWSYDVKIINDYLLVSTSNNSIWYRNDLSVNTPDNHSFTKADENINVFPNPSTGYVNIDCREEVSMIQIYDMWGRKLLDKHTNQKTCSIDLTKMKSGVYFIRIKSEGRFTSEKIILY